MRTAHPTAGKIEPAGIDLSDVDGFWTKSIEHRHAAFNALREMRGLPFFAEPESNLVPGPGYYALTKLDDIAAASRTPAVYTSSKGSTSWEDMPVEFLEFYGSMINMDEPRHSRLRRIVSRGFTPKMLDVLTDNVATVAKRIVDDVIEIGECDAVTEISARLPLTIICDMMGIPESQHKFVFDRTNVMLGAQDPEYVPDADNIFQALIDAGQDLGDLVKDLAAQRMKNPTDDLISTLLNARIVGEKLTPDEIASFFILLVGAGNETTRNALSWGINLISENPEQRATWLADLENVTPLAVEEIVRWASPVIYMRRTLSEPAELSEQRLEAHDKVLLFYWAANRDPAHFTNPERFDVLRSPNSHIGFGGPGPHFCLGAHLARREITVMFRELLTRIPDIHATAEPVRLRSAFINGIKHLPVAFTAGGAR